MARNVLSGPTLQAATAACAIAGGAVWLLWNGIALASDSSSGGDCSSASDYAGDVTFALAGVLVAMALLGVATQLPPIQRVVAIVAAIASATFVIANAVEHCVYEPVSLLYVMGALVHHVSIAALGLGWLLTGTMGRWRGLLLIAAAAFIGFDQGGAAVHGAAWLLLGASLFFTRPRGLAGDAAP